MEDVLTPDQYAMLLQLGGDNAGLQDDIKRQMAQADQLRMTELPGMRGNGRVQVAPHALELLGGLARNWKAGELGKSSADLQKQANQNTNQQNMMIMQGILRGQGQQRPMPAGLPTGNPYDQFRIPGSA